MSMSQKKKKVSQISADPKPERIRQSRNPDAASPEKDRKIADRIRALAEPLCEAGGIELVHVEYQREPRGRILRLYIDKPGGVMLDDCADVSQQVGDLLDAGFEDIGPYHLEVSSPGQDRPLGKLSDFEKYRGQRAKISTSRPVAGKKKIQGILNGVSDGEMIALQIGDSTVLIPFQEIVRARLVNCRGEKGC
ncbi:MAG: ribosome maturation factor RimP [Desulfobacterales bacterium]